VFKRLSRPQAREIRCAALFRALAARKEFWERGPFAGSALPADIEEILAIADRIEAAGNRLRKDGRMDPVLRAKLEAYDHRFRGRRRQRPSSWYGERWKDKLVNRVRQMERAGTAEIFKQWVRDGADPFRLSALLDVREKVPRSNRDRRRDFRFDPLALPLRAHLELTTLSGREREVAELLNRLRAENDRRPQLTAEQIRSQRSRIREARLQLSPDDSEGIWQQPLERALEAEVRRRVHNRLVCGPPVSMNPSTFVAETRGRKPKKRK
jgi:hypothetical protein